MVGLNFKEMTLEELIASNRESLAAGLRVNERNIETNKLAREDKSCLMNLVTAVLLGILVLVCLTAGPPFVAKTLQKSTCLAVGVVIAVSTRNLVMDKSNKRLLVVSAGTAILSVAIDTVAIWMSSGVLDHKTDSVRLAACTISLLSVIITVKIALSAHMASLTNKTDSDPNLREQNE